MDWREDDDFFQWIYGKKFNILDEYDIDIAMQRLYDIYVYNVRTFNPFPALNDKYDLD